MVKRDIEKQVVPYCIENDISILAYSPLERGLLTGKLKPGHHFAEGDHRAAVYFFKDENIKRTNLFLDSMKVMCREKNTTLAQLVIRWTVEQPGITIALVGARNEQQSVQNAKAIRVKLSREEIDFINVRLEWLWL